MLGFLDAPVLALDLPGRGRHPAPLDQVHIADFVESAVNDIEDADAQSAVLVGHSMAGVSLPGIVDRIHQRLSHIVFLSCVVPAHGESMLSELPPKLRELAERVAPDPAGSFPGRKLSIQTMCNEMSEKQTAFTLDVRVPEAYWPMRDPVDLSGLRHPVPRTWVKLLRDRTPPPEHVDVLAQRVGCTDIVELDTQHFAMITEPRALADLLNEIHARSNAGPLTG
jgi:pimeloyl-ACP methyl ester carboxylesterase